MHHLETIDTTSLDASIATMERLHGKEIIIGKDDYLRVIDELMADKADLAAALYSVMTVTMIAGDRELYQICRDALNKMRNPTLKK